MQNIAFSKRNKHLFLLQQDIWLDSWKTKSKEKKREEPQQSLKGLKYLSGMTEPPSSFVFSSSLPGVISSGKSFFHSPTYWANIHWLLWWAQCQARLLEGDNISGFSGLTWPKKKLQVLQSWGSKAAPTRVAGDVLRGFPWVLKSLLLGLSPCPFFLISPSVPLPLACVLLGLPVDNEQMSSNQQMFFPQRTASPVLQTIWGLFLSAANGSISLIEWGQYFGRPHVLFRFRQLLIFLRP